MSEQTPTSTHLVGSLSDPVITFQHTIEAQRNAALAHESLLTFQLGILKTDLEATRRMIVGCDSALAALSSGVLTNLTEEVKTEDDQNTQQSTPPTPPPVDEYPPVTPADNLDPPSSPDDIPPFLTAARDRSAA